MGAHENGFGIPQGFDWSTVGSDGLACGSLVVLPWVSLWSTMGFQMDLHGSRVWASMDFDELPWASRGGSMCLVGLSWASIWTSVDFHGAPMSSNSSPTRTSCHAPPMGCNGLAWNSMGLPVGRPRATHGSRESLVDLPHGSPVACPWVPMGFPRFSHGFLWTTQGFSLGFNMGSNGLPLNSIGLP